MCLKGDSKAENAEEFKQRVKGLVHRYDAQFQS